MRVAALLSCSRTLEVPSVSLFDTSKDQRTPELGGVCLSHFFEEFQKLTFGHCLIFLRASSLVFQPDFCRTSGSAGGGLLPLHGSAVGVCGPGATWGGVGQRGHKS